MVVKTPLLYETLQINSIRSFQRIEKQIWVRERLTVSAIKWSDYRIAKIIQRWDPKRTRLVNAACKFSVHGSVPWSIPVPSIEAWIRVNGVEVGHGGWSPWTSCTTRAGTVDITEIFINGENTVEAELRGYFLTLECTLTVDCTLILQFEGEMPPPPMTPQEELMLKIFTYAVLGTVAIGGTVVLVKYVIPELRKRKA